MTELTSYLTDFDENSDSYNLKMHMKNLENAIKKRETMMEERDKAKNDTA